MFESDWIAVFRKTAIGLSGASGWIYVATGIYGLYFILVMMPLQLLLGDVGFALSLIMVPFLAVGLLIVLPALALMMCFGRCGKTASVFHTSLQWLLGAIGVFTALGMTLSALLSASLGAIDAGYIARVVIALSWGGLNCYVGALRIND